MYKILFTFLMFAIFLFVSCGASKQETSENSAKNDTTASTKDTKENKDENNSGNKEKNNKIELIPVEVTTINKGSISSYLLLSSNLETEKMADVYSRVQGLVQKIHYEEGDYVRKDQILMELEADEYKLAEERAHVNYLQQKSAFERAKEMHNRELLSPQEFEQVKFSTEGAKIEWEQGKLNLSYTNIKSPINGVIGERLIRLGDRIQPTDKLFSVINTEEMIAIVYVPEKELETINRNQKAFIFSDNVQGQLFAGWVKRVSPAVDPQSGTFKVIVGVKNVENILRPGMFVNVRIVTATHNDAILIPKTAIVYENEAMNVYVVRDSIARRVALKPGFQDHQNIETLSGVKEGEKIIVVGQAGLKDSTKVKIIAEKENKLKESS
jgi:membrane fusion protein (multidrug efflux system)